jgi:hypothetical protein
VASKRSRAVAAAEKIAPRASDPKVSARWTKSMVERAIMAFSDIDRIPQYDEDSIRRYVKDFLKFVKRVELGGVEKEAEPIAHAYIDIGYAWLDAHPQYVPFTTPAWTLDMVEQTVMWFADAISGPLDRKRSIELADRLKTFERVVHNESIEPGDAATLAHAFLDHALRWMENHPDVLDHYQALD